MKSVIFGNQYSGMKPILKWTGGKESELQQYILPNMPKDINRFIEPFVGGGSVFMGVTAQKFMINDISQGLMKLYRIIKKQDENFFTFAMEADLKWSAIEKFTDERKDDFTMLEMISTETERNEEIELFIRKNYSAIRNMIPDEFNSYSRFFIDECDKALKSKFNAISKFMQKGGKNNTGFEFQDIRDMVVTAFKSSFYKVIREEFNHHCDMPDDICAFVFLFIMTFSYCGMSRYNSAGDFNVPYGGISYNKRSIYKLVSYYRNHGVINKFKRTQCHNMDFEFFLKLYDLGKDDFIFLDPPYDSAFSNYMNNAFTKDDHIRLFKCLEKQKAKWMAIIKKTDFIYNLYSSENNIRITEFNKEYRVNIKNRNDRRVTHLIISNYDLPLPPKERSLF